MRIRYLLAVSVSLVAALPFSPALAEDAQPNIGAMMALLGGCTYGKAMASGQIDSLTKKIADLEKELADLKGKSAPPPESPKQ